MASNKTNKNTSKKRNTKKVMKGGNICDMICPRDKKSDEDNQNEKSVEEESVEEEPVEEESIEEEPVEGEPAEEESVEEGPAEEELKKTDSLWGRGGKKTRKNKPIKKIRKTSKNIKSTWIIFVKEIYNKNKQKNPLYMFKDALKDAAKLYKK